MQPEELLGRTPDSFEMEFKGGRKALFANPRNIPFRIGDFAIVEVERGHDIGKVIREGSGVSKKLKSKGIQGPMLRRATDKDIATMRALREKETEAHRTCQQCIAKQGLPMKLVDVEWQFDSNKIRFYFTSDRRVDFRKLVRDLASIFKSRIEMRQIGVRDEARRLGGYGRCGRYYCCRGVINDFDPVTLKMVKEQHLAPGSPKISGGCGRLMCCLRYERDFYKEASREYPKLGTRIEMGEGRGKGKVVAVDIFHGRVTVSDKEGATTVVAIDDFKKGRITDVGADEAQRALDDYWKDVEGAEDKVEVKSKQEQRGEQGKQEQRGEQGKQEGQGKREQRSEQGKRERRGGRSGRGEQRKRGEQGKRNGKARKNAG